MCLECRSKTKLYNTKASAIKAWNTRKPMQNIVERLEEEKSKASKCVTPQNILGHVDWVEGIDKAIEIVKGEGGLNDQ